MSTSTKEIMIAILESQLKIKEVLTDNLLSGHPMYLVTVFEKQEIERQLKELKGE